MRVDQPSGSGSSCSPASPALRTSASSVTSLPVSASRGPGRRDQRPRRASGAKRRRVPAGEVDAVHLGEAVPGQVVVSRGNEPVAQHGDRALAAGVEEGDRASLGTVADHRLDLDSVSAQLRSGAAPMVVVAERREERRGAGRAWRAARRRRRRRRPPRTTTCPRCTISPASGTRATVRKSTHSTCPTTAKRDMRQFNPKRRYGASLE